MGAVEILLYNFVIIYAAFLFFFLNLFRLLHFSGNLFVCFFFFFSNFFGGNPYFFGRLYFIQLLPN